LERVTVKRYEDSIGSLRSASPLKKKVFERKRERAKLPRGERECRGEKK